MTLSLLAEALVRIACGLSAILLVTPWRQVPPAYFRTHCLVILGLLVASALDVARLGQGGWAWIPLASAAVLAYLGSVAWGLGLPRVGLPVQALITTLAGAVLLAASPAREPLSWSIDAAGRLGSAFLLGGVLSAMLLGHHYLIAPSMSITPLMRLIRASAWGLGVRVMAAALGVALWKTQSLGSAMEVSSLLMAIRWGMGVLGPALALYLAWKTAEIRSTQSATGILYIAVTLAIFGELTAMVLTRESGILV